MSPLSKADFHGLDQTTWLYTGAESPPHRGMMAAVNEYLQGRALGPGGREANALAETACRAQLAELLHGEAASIALLSNASEAISSVVRALDLKPGENIVLSTLEYPSGVLAALTQQANGVEVRVVPHRDWDYSVEDLLAQVDEGTRLVIASHVSYLSGARLDYALLYQALQGTGTLLLLDATQSFGVVPVDLRQADFIVSSTYKWLLAMHGGGVLAVNPARTSHLVSDSAGWRSVAEIFRSDRFESFERYPDARQFELGYPSFATLHALNFSTRLLLDTGIQSIENHILHLGRCLYAGLRELGFTVLTPNQDNHRAGNIAWVCTRGEEVAEALRTQNILLWGGDGRVRASIHGFNDTGDIETLLQALRRLRPLLDGS